MKDGEERDSLSSEQLLPLVYEEVRILASQRLAQYRLGLKLPPTALVHEAYLRLAANGSSPWNSEGHFFAAAALAMRRILVENARQRAATKRGGGNLRIPLEEFHRIVDSPEDLMDLDDALNRFAAEEPEKANLVHLRFFAGLTSEEAAEALGISLATAERWWSYAKAWLYVELRNDRTDSENP